MLELFTENEFSTVRTAANPNQITTLLTTTSIDIVIRYEFFGRYQ